MRKIEDVTVPQTFSRDAGKVFRITEWSAKKADDWSVRVVLAYNRGGGDLPLINAIAGRGMEAVAYVGIQTFLRGNIKPEEVIPILDELLECVQIVRSLKAIDQVTGLPLATQIVSDDDIEEVKTRWWLRSEVLRIHTGFSLAEVLSKWISAIMKPASETTQT